MSFIIPDVMYTWRTITRAMTYIHFPSTELQTYFMEEFGGSGGSKGISYSLHHSIHKMARRKSCYTVCWRTIGLQLSSSSICMCFCICACTVYLRMKEIRMIIYQLSQSYWSGWSRCSAAVHFCRCAALTFSVFLPHDVIIRRAAWQLACLHIKPCFNESQETQKKRITLCWSCQNSRANSSHVPGSQMIASPYLGHARVITTEYAWLTSSQKFKFLPTVYENACCLLLTRCSICSKIKLHRAHLLILHTTRALGTHPP